MGCEWVLGGWESGVSGMGVGEVGGPRLSDGVFGRGESGGFGGWVGLVLMGVRFMWWSWLW